MVLQLAEALSRGKLTKYFGDMTNLRKQALLARQQPTEQKRLILNGEGRQEEAGNRLEPK